MKHDWKRDASGKIEEFGDEYPYVECRICGDIATMGWQQTELDADDCEGMNPSVEVFIGIIHPGNAVEHDDWTSLRQEIRIPLAQLLDADPDPVGEALANFVELIAGDWRGARTAHEPAWRAAVEAASGCSVRETTEAKP